MEGSAMVGLYVGISALLDYSISSKLEFLVAP